MLLAPVISVTKVLFESNTIVRSLTTPLQFISSEKKLKIAFGINWLVLKKWKAQNIGLTQYSPFEGKRSTKGGQGDERVITFFVCFSTLKGNIAGEFRESKLKLSPGGLLDIHGDLKVIVKLNVKQRIITSFDWADLGSLFYKWVKIFEKQIIEHKIIHLKEYKT